MVGARGHTRRRAATRFDPDRPSGVAIGWRGPRYLATSVASSKARRAEREAPRLTPTAERVLLRRRLARSRSEQTQYALLRNAACGGALGRPCSAAWRSRSPGPATSRARAAARRRARPRTTRARRWPTSGRASGSRSSTATRRSTTRCCCRRARTRGSRTPRRLWNAAEAAERRKDAQVARELVVALPADRELAHEDRVELVRSFALEHFVAKGLAVQLDVHAPHAGDAESDRANYHAHLLVTTRRVEGDRLSARKARDLEPEVRRVGGRAAVTDGERWGALWCVHQDRYFAGQGLALRVDAPDAVPQVHVGPVRMRAPGSEAAARLEEIARENAAAARDPGRVLEALTRNSATFTERELDRYLSKHVRDEAERLAVKGRVLAHADLLALHDRETGEAAGRYTTRAVREQERAALRDAGEVAGSRRHRAVGEGARTATLEGRSLRADQRAAFEHATGAGGLRIIEGRAGTGKSYTLGAVREAHERAGYAVVGLGADEQRGAGPEGGRVRPGGDGAFRAVPAQERARDLGRPHAGRGGRGGDAGQPHHGRAAGRGAAQRGQAGARRRRPAARERRARRAVRRAQGAARLGGDHRGDAAEGGLAAAGRARPGRGAGGGGGARLRARAGDHLGRHPGRGHGQAGRALGGGHRGRPGRDPVRVRLHEQGCRRAERRLAPGAARAGRAGRGCPARHQARAGGLRGRRPGAVHRHAQGGEDPQRQRRHDHGRRRAHGRGRGDPGRPGRAGAGGGVVGLGVRRVPARLRRDDLQGAGQDAGPHLPLPLAPLAAGLVLRGADPPAGVAPGSSPRPRRRGTCASWRGRWAGTRCGRPRWRGPRARSCRPGCGPRPGGPPRAGAGRGAAVRQGDVDAGPRARS